MKSCIDVIAAVQVSNCRNASRNGRLKKKTTRTTAKAVRNLSARRNRLSSSERVAQIERRGFISSSWGESEAGRRRKYYRLTERGAKELARQRRQWEIVDSALRGLWFAGLAPAPQGR